MDFKVGDFVRIREWEDMAREYGITNRNDSIPVRFSFPPNMREICGKEFKITRISGRRIFGHRTGWEVSDEMIELVGGDMLSEQIDAFICLYDASEVVNECR